jgi:formylmethanofuran dehydrogenase subunit E
MTFEEIIQFHGHECPGLAMGYRMAAAAMNKLDSIRAEDEDIKIRKSIPCSFCGENVMESRINQLGGKPTCIPCFENNSS